MNLLLLLLLLDERDVGSAVGRGRESEVEWSVRAAWAVEWSVREEWAACSACGLHCVILQVT